MNTLRLALIQSALYWENAKMNRQMFSWKIRDLSGEADLIVLPEMFSTGFTMKPEHVAEEPDGATTDWMKELAHETGAVITGSVVIRDQHKYYNRLLWVDPHGQVLHYDKRHLFAMAGEHNVYTAGTKQLIAEWKDWRICPMICYDLRFPVWSRNTQDYDLLLYVANWPEPRRTHWQHLLRARAIENQCFTAGVNRLGRDENGLEYCGDSTLIDYQGEILASSSHSETTLQVTINRDDLKTWRDRFPFLADRDTFSLTS